MPPCQDLTEYDPSHRAPTRRRVRVDLMGVPVDALTHGETVRRIFWALGRGQGGWVVTANLDQLRQAKKDPELARLFTSADLVTSDGTTLLWASRILGTPLPERVAGADLIFSISAEAAKQKASVFLLGGTPATAGRAAAALQQRYAGLRIAGIECPPLGFDSDPDSMARLERSLTESAPSLVYVCLGFPKQERVIERLRSALPAAWFFGLGGSLAFAAGEIPRAPRWMQRAGLEWTHRLAHEPRRLFERFVVLDLPFAFGFLLEAGVARARARWTGDLARYIELDEVARPSRGGLRLPLAR